MSAQTPSHPEPSGPGTQSMRTLVFERDAHACAAMLRTLKQAGMAAERVKDAASIVEAMRDGEPTVVIADLFGDDLLFDDLRKALASSAAPSALIAVSGTLTAERAIRWMRLGAADVLIKPIDPLELSAAVARAADQMALRLRPARRDGGQHDMLGGIVGDDPKLQHALHLARAASRVRSTALLEGETGTGKSMLARAIHLASQRASGPFVEIACGSIPESLLESELFGHVKGAFTGAIADKKGRFLAANGGTIFLDELNSASMATQLKLLRVLQERSFEPVGSDTSISVDVRVIAASNEPLESLVEEGRFREDLFHRVSVLPIALPSLRERTTDLDRLATHFLAQKSAELDRTILGFTRDALDAMRSYAWPGNVRELENAIERAAVLCEGAWIERSHLPERVLSRARTIVARPIAVAQTQAPTEAMAEAPREAPTEAPPLPTSAADTARSLSELMRDPERSALIAALERNGWNRSKAARALGIDRTTLYRKMRGFGIGQYGQAG